MCHNFDLNFSVKPDVYWTTLIVNGMQINFEVDTGSAISAIPYSCYMEKFSTCKLRPYRDLLRAYDGTVIDTCGFIAHFIIVKNGCRPLVGRDVLSKLEFTFDFNSIGAVSRIDEIAVNFKNVLDERLG